MAGLVPAIHAVFSAVAKYDQSESRGPAFPAAAKHETKQQDVGGRDKPGHDVERRVRSPGKRQDHT
jgi:hypothetical protein